MEKNDDSQLVYTHFGNPATCYQHADIRIRSQGASLLQLVDKLQEAGKVDNLQQVCGVFGCMEPVADLA